MDNTIKRKGQCFLCQADVIMELKISSTTGTNYVCPECGGLNSVTRVEQGMDIRRCKRPYYMPVIKTKGDE